MFVFDFLEEQWTSEKHVFKNLKKKKNLHPLLYCIIA